MESIPYHPLVTVTKEELQKVRSFYELNDLERLRESIDAVHEWCQKQEHLVLKDINKNVIERLFIINRGSVEGTKKKIDKFFTFRGMMPELTLKRSVGEFEKFWDCVTYVPLPKLCPTDCSRVMVTQFTTENLDEFTLLTYFRYCFMLGEYRINHDYSLSERYIIDLSNLRLSHMSKINPVIMKKAEVLCTEGFGTKIKGIHLLNAPPFVDRVVFIFKQALREKVASRLHVHQNLEELQEHVPKEVLPKDFGGDGPSVAKLQAQWKDELRTPEAQKIIADCDKMVTDESKRCSNKFNEEYLGMPGSFRKLNVD